MESSLTLNESLLTHTTMANSVSNNTGLSCDINYYFFRFSINVFIGSILVFIGIAGNILSIIVLRKDWSRSSMSVLLSVLGLYDIMFLISSVYYVIYKHGILTIRHDLNLSITVTKVLLPLVWYIGHVSRCGRNWTAVVVAIDRYVVVYRPFQASSRSNPHRAKIYSLLITLFTFTYNLSRLWEWKAIYKPTYNITVMQANPDLTQIYNLIYGKILFTLLYILGPMILLILFNSLLTISVFKASKRRLVMTHHVTRHLSTNSSNHNQSVSSFRRNHDTKMLVIVIGVFIVTELPSLILQLLMNNRAIQSSYQCARICIISPLVDILALVNSSSNFFLYCLCGLRFRENLKLLFRPRHRGNHITNHHHRLNTSHYGDDKMSICQQHKTSGHSHPDQTVTVNNSLIESASLKHDCVKETCM